MSPEDQKLINLEKSALAIGEALDEPITIPFTNLKFSIRGLIDYPRIKLQTRLSEKPPVLDTNELKTPFGPITVRKFQPLFGTVFANPVNLFRLGANIAIRTASFITPHDYKSFDPSTTSPVQPIAYEGRPILSASLTMLAQTVNFIGKCVPVITSIPLAKTISYRGRQGLGAGLTMLAQAGNVVVKGAALNHHRKRIAIIKKGIAANNNSKFCTDDTLKEAEKAYRETSKNLALATVLTTGAVGGSAYGLGAAPLVAAAHAATVATHGYLPPILEFFAGVKKTAAVAKEEGEHMQGVEAIGPTKNASPVQGVEAIDPTKNASPVQGASDSNALKNRIKTHLGELEHTIDTSKDTAEVKQAFAQQKRMLHLLGEIDPTFVSHGVKRAIGYTKETHEDMLTRVGKEVTTKQEDYKTMKETLSAHTNKTNAPRADLNEDETHKLYQAKIRANKSPNR